MNAKTLSILLVLVGLGLGAGWFMTTKRAADESAANSARIAALSNDLVSTTFKLTEQQKVNASLETNLVQRVEELGTFSNRWTYVTGELSRTETEAKAAAAAAQAEIERRDKQIAGLEGEKDDLTKRMDGLNVEIGGLNNKISDTEQKLAASEGDRNQLQKELKRLLAEKAELERKFNDLAVLRDQVRKLKEELSIARRLDFIRRGLYGFDKKGAQVLNEGIRPVAAAKPATNQTIKGELGTDGSVKVQAPTAAEATPPK
jgi:chromosome segregation ATPase